MLLWSVFAVRVVPILICQNTTWWIASCIFVSLWVCSFEIHASCCFDVLCWTFITSELWTVYSFFKSTIATEIKFIWQGPAIHLTSIKPIILSNILESCFKFTVYWGWTPVWRAWKLRSSRLSNCTILTSRVTVILRPKSGCWNPFTWDTIISCISWI